MPIFMANIQQLGMKGGPVAGDRLAIPGHLPLYTQRQTDQRPHQRGLAGAIGACHL